MHSINGGWHGLAGWCFRRLPATGAGLWADDGGNSLSDAGSSIAAANLRLAELRSVSEIPGAAGFPRLLGAETRGTASFGPRRAFQTDQDRRTARRRRRVPVALSSLGSRGPRRSATPSLRAKQSRMSAQVWIASSLRSSQ